MRIGAFDGFHGPFTTTTALVDLPGIYVITCTTTSGEFVVDVGESATVRSRVHTHDRREQWSQCGYTGQLNAYVLYTPGARQPQRMLIEQELRAQLNPPCGDR